LELFSILLPTLGLSNVALQHLTSLKSITVNRLLVQYSIIINRNQRRGVTILPHYPLSSVQSLDSLPAPSNLRRWLCSTPDLLWLFMSALLLLISFLLLVPPPARALWFDLESGHTKCIIDEINFGSMAVGKYHVIDPDPNFLNT
jgi:hypothetical protein